jgi:hypothetical protein
LETDRRSVLRGGRGSLEDIRAGQRGHGRVCGLGKQLTRAADLQQTPAIDYRDAPGKRGRIVEGVGDQKRRKFELSQMIAELVTYLPSRERVERAERLVEQQHPRVASERTSERYALTLPP